ncbi:hypothetical protein Taro_049463 [Colocasia esculenta]|uniref:DDE Tnp4 domain-containing protein n=1 Tax=Colocasia esculenta TaxID=4460 RepID=A0A843XAU1_COLES|nr:hypothetical protein [Colocasia esculenta]
MYAMGHGVASGAMCEHFQHSSETISKHVCEVTKALASLRFNYIKLPSLTDPVHPRIRHDDRFYPYFKDAIGAIDGTHVPVHILREKQARYWNCKGVISQNVMGVCGFDLVFQYVGVDFEGAATDMAVLRRAMDVDGFHILEGGREEEDDEPEEDPYLSVSASDMTAGGSLRDAIATQLRSPTRLKRESPITAKPCRTGASTSEPGELKIKAKPCQTEDPHSEAKEEHPPFQATPSDQFLEFGVDVRLCTLEQGGRRLPCPLHPSKQRAMSPSFFLFPITLYSVLRSAFITLSPHILHFIYSLPTSFSGLTPPHEVTHLELNLLCRPAGGSSKKSPCTLSRDLRVKGMLRPRNLLPSFSSDPHTSLGEGYLPIGHSVSLC